MRDQRITINSAVVVMLSLLETELNCCENLSHILNKCRTYLDCSLASQVGPQKAHINMVIYSQQCVQRKPPVFNLLRGRF